LGGVAFQIEWGFIFVASAWRGQRATASTHRAKGQANQTKTGVRLAPNGCQFEAELLTCAPAPIASVADAARVAATLHRIGAGEMGGEGGDAAGGGHLRLVALTSLSFDALGEERFVPGGR
jgi:hypothetical protein